MAVEPVAAKQTVIGDGSGLWACGRCDGAEGGDYRMALTELVTEPTHCRRQGPAEVQRSEEPVGDGMFCFAYLTI
jgi:hypothetical protein